MVGIKCFLFLSAFLLWAGNAATYGIRPSDIERFKSEPKPEQQELSKDAEKEIDAMILEKKKLIEESSPLREQREKNLRPFVSTTVSQGKIVLQQGIEPDRIVPEQPVKAFIYSEYDKELSKIKPSPKNKPSLITWNIMFFSFLIAAFLASYFLIKPKRK